MKPLNQRDRSERYGSNRPHPSDQPKRVAWQDTPKEVHWEHLLDSLPEYEYHLGRFSGYNAGRSIRRKIVIGFGLMCTIGLTCCFFFTRHREYQRFRPFPLDTIEVEASQRILKWRDGFARLGMFRETPGINQIQLPDRNIFLADGCDHAQILVEVRHQRTVLVEPIVGKILQTKRQPASAMQ